MTEFETGTNQEEYYNKHNTIYSNACIWAECKYSTSSLWLSIFWGWLSSGLCILKSKEYLMVTSHLAAPYIIQACGGNTSLLPISFRYVATPDGAMRMFPAALTRKRYEPSQSHWYRQATRLPGRIMLTRPYVDTAGAGFIVTVSHSIYEGRWVFRLSVCPSICESCVNTALVF